MTEHEFNMESERVQQLIRRHKIRGLWADEQREGLLADAKEVKVELGHIAIGTARTEVQIARTNLKAKEQKLLQADIGLRTEAIATQISKVGLQGKQSDLQLAQAGLMIHQQKNLTHLEELNLGLQEARKVLNNRRTLLQLQGKV